MRPHDVARHRFVVWCVTALAMLAAACGDDSPPPPADAGMPPVRRDAGMPAPFTADWTCGGSGENCAVSSLAAGGWLADDGHTLAQLADGRVVGWGVATRAVPALGMPDTADRRPHLFTELGPATDVAAAGSSSCVLRDDGTVRCAGSGYQVGDGTLSTDFRAADVSGLDDVLSLGAGAAFTCAVRVDGSVVCWGFNSVDFESDAAPLFPGCATQPWLSSPCPVSGVVDAVQVVAGYRHACVLDSVGHVACWGGNDVGQLGDGTTAPRTDVVRVVALDGVRSLAAGGTTTCALRADRSVACWGYLGEGLPDIVGRGDDACPTLLSACALSPTPIDGLADIVALGVGKEHACALDTDGTLRCWGGNRAGQLGTGDFNAHTLPVEVNTSVQLFAVGRMHTCVVTSSGRILCVGDDEDGQLGAGDIAPFTCFGVSGQAYPCSPAWLDVLGLSAL